MNGLVFGEFINNGPVPDTELQHGSGLATLGLPGLNFIIDCQDQLSWSEPGGEQREEAISSLGEWLVRENVLTFFLKADDRIPAEHLGVITRVITEANCGLYIVAQAPPKSSVGAAYRCMDPGDARLALADPCEYELMMR
jgi:hypothetical protein